MKCKECESQGLKSKVYPGHGYSTLIYCAPFYDEDGVYHHHDMNSTAYDARCSNGHTWMEVTYPKCPNCEWVNGN